VKRSLARFRHRYYKVDLKKIDEKAWTGFIWFIIRLPFVNITIRLRTAKMINIS